MFSTDDLAGTLLSFMDTIRTAAQAALPEACSLMQVKTLDFISRSREPSMSAVAEFLKITSPGATMVVDKLVENGELLRETDPRDRRVIRLSVTPKGHKALERSHEIIATLLNERLSKLSKTEQKDFRQLLQKVSA